jgi:tRNA1Val (adenine37-N6)-methyltransferase
VIAATRDALLGGRVVYDQPARGYRVAVEAPLLARFAIALRPSRCVVDLGAGPGAVSLCLAVTGWASRVVAIEIDEAHAELARRNAETNRVAMTVIESDVAHVRDVAGDLVIANPPWFETDTGGVSADPRRAAARTFTRGSLGAFVTAARRLLAPRGRVVLSMPASRLAETIGALVRVGLHAKRMRFVHPREGEEADVVFIEAKPGKAGGLAIETPLFIRQNGERYTEEVARTLAGDWISPAAAGTA